MKAKFPVFGLMAIMALMLSACSSGDSGGGGGSTSDTTPPNISGVSSSSASTGATISWSTDEAADSQVEYGTTIAYGSSTPMTKSLLTNHGFALPGLLPSTEYHYRVKSADASGNMSTSSDFAFTTAAAGAKEEWVVLANDTGNNLTMFKASASSPVQTPIPQLGLPVNFGNAALGEIHFAHGKAFVAISSGLPAPAPVLQTGGVAVVNPVTQNVENIVTLTSITTKADGTPAASRPVHVYLDPEAKYLWVNNDGPSGDAGADSAFRINVDPEDPNYLTYIEVIVGNGHKKSAFSRPSADQPTAKKLFFTSSLTEQRIDLIDEEAGVVVKTIRHVGASPHGMDYSPASGKAFAGLTGGGVVSIDATKLDLNSDGVIDVPDFDCAMHSDCNDGTDPSVAKMTATGMTDNPTLLAGYVHVYTNEHGEDTVYTSGRSSALDEGYLTAIDPLTNTAEAVIVFPGYGISSFDFAEGGTKIYVPSNGSGTVKNKVGVVDADHDSPTHNTLLYDVLVGEAGGDRNGEVSADGRLVVYPNNCATCNTVSIIDTLSDTVIDTLTITGPASRAVGMVKLTGGAEDNH
jgi:hypothetical protein